MKELTTQQNSVKALFETPAVQNKLREIVGENHRAFTTSVLQIVANNEQLKNAEPMSVFMAAATAATLNLPINNNLGFAWIVPYKNKGQQVAQFQIGYKGLIQLAIRSGQFKTISATPVYAGQLKSQNPLTGFEFDWSVRYSDEVVGYAAYLELKNGFEKTLFVSRKQMEAHARRFSKTYDFGPWRSDFDAMGTKTVLKQLLSKYAPLSIEMQQAIEADQATINEDGTFAYPDNEDDKKDRAAALLADDQPSQGNQPEDAVIEDDDDLI